MCFGQSWENVTNQDKLRDIRHGNKASHTASMILVKLFLYPSSNKDGDFDNNIRRIQHPVWLWL